MITAPGPGIVGSVRESDEAVDSRVGSVGPVRPSFPHELEGPRRARYGELLGAAAEAHRVRSGTLGHDELVEDFLELFIFYTHDSLVVFEKYSFVEAFYFP